MTVQFGSGVLFWKSRSPNNGPLADTGYAQAFRENHCCVTLCVRSPIKNEKGLARANPKRRESTINKFAN
jgi:hypothetical protein